MVLLALKFMNPLKIHADQIRKVKGLLQLLNAAIDKMCSVLFSVEVEWLTPSQPGWIAEIFTSSHLIIFSWETHPE